MAAPTSGTELDAQRELVSALAQQLRAQLIETPISWVLLTEGLAYKIKKALRLPFVDYASLPRRRHFCEEELRLNRRLAPSLYLSVAAITGSLESPVIDGPGPSLEYAVRMRRFPPGALFSEALAAGALTPERVDRLAALLARFHADAPSCSAEIPPEAPSLQARALAALAGAGEAMSAQLHASLTQWLLTHGATLQPLRQRRRNEGHVRECHGDLHLDNIVFLEDDQVAAFDGIEFDPALRCIDVIDDVSFTLMDFHARGRPDLGWRFINGWLEHTGDHAALPLLRYSVVYRALVRAQVEHLRQPASEAARRYAATAQAWTQPLEPRLIITSGLPGSGKTFVSQQLLQQLGAIRLRSDVERKRLFGLGMLDDSRALGTEIYTADATRRTYERLYDTARLSLRAGYPVILDAAFLRRDERRHAHAVATEEGVPFSIAHCEAPLDVLRQRIASRQGDASEADLAVLEKLRAVAEPLDEAERPFRLPLPASVTASPQSHS